MELKDLVVLYRRWLWLLIIGLALGLAAGYAASRVITPVYEASAKVLITRSRQQGISDLLPLSDQQLVLTYQQLLKARPILDEAGSKLEIKIDPGNIRIEVVPNTQIIQIKIQDESPALAAAIANALVQILIEQNEILQAGRYTIYEESLNSQVTEVQKQINSLQGQISQINQTNITEQLNLVDQQITNLQNEISNLEKEIAQFPNSLTTADRVSLAEKQAQLGQLRSLLPLYQQIQTNLTFIGQPLQGVNGLDDPRITSLQATLNLYQELYLNLLKSLETVKLARVQSTPTVTEIEEAIVPDKPIRPIPLLYIALSGTVGLLSAAGSVLLIDYFDDTLRSAQKIQEILGIPVIGEIAEINRKHKQNGKTGLTELPDPAISNAFGTLRINVSRLLTQETIKTILVTSPTLGEGKTTIATNLARAFEHSGKRVILLDADSYHPELHNRFGLENRIGLNNILADPANWREASHDCGKLTIITSGTSLTSPAGLLETDDMNRLLEELQEHADVVIIDGPPMFVVDTQILASRVGGILLIIRQGSTITAMARAMLKQLKLVEANVLGVVLNRVPRAEAYYFDGYYRDGRIIEQTPKQEETTVPQELKSN